MLQTISVRLVLNLVNVIFRSATMPSADLTIVRSLLFRIMSCLILKFGTLQRLIPRIINSEKLKKAQAATKTKAEQSVHQSILGGGMPHSHSHTLRRASCV